MVDKTLYDILEVSPGAPSEVVLAAYERLSQKYDPQNPANSGNPDIKILRLAVEDAYLTINNPGKRAQYDKKLEARARAMYQPVVVVESFWTTPKLIVIALIALAGGGYYYSQKKAEAKLAAEIAIAEARAQEAREAAEKARSTTEEARLILRQQQQERMAEDRARRERDQALRQFSNEQRAYSSAANSPTMRERQEQQREFQRQREEQQAAVAARNVADKEKAELCRLERERYGRAISC